MMFEVIGLDMIVPSGTLILAAVRGDVFRREAKSKAGRAYDIAPMLLRIAPDILVVLASRLRFPTSVANRHLSTEPA